MGIAGRLLVPATSIITPAESGLRLCENDVDDASFSQSGESPFAQTVPASMQSGERAIVRSEEIPEGVSAENEPARHDGSTVLLPRAPRSVVPPPPMRPRLSTRPVLHALPPAPSASYPPANYSSYPPPPVALAIPTSSPPPAMYSQHAPMHLAAVQALMIAAANGWIGQPTPQQQQSVIQAPPQSTRAPYVVLTTAIISVMATMIVFMMSAKMTTPIASTSAPPSTNATSTPTSTSTTNATTNATSTSTTNATSTSTPNSTTTSTPNSTTTPSSHVHRSPPRSTAPVASTVAPIAAPTPVAAPPASNAASQKKLDDAARSAEMLRSQLDSSIN